MCWCNVKFFPMACKALSDSNLRCRQRRLLAYPQAGPAEAAKPANTFQASKAAEAEFERIIKERSGGKLPSLSLRPSSEVRLSFAQACAATAIGPLRKLRRFPCAAAQGGHEGEAAQ